MKKSIFSVSLLLAGLAFAGSVEITNDCIIGVMPIKSNALAQVILSVPWVAEGGGSDFISVSNLVKTAGLTAGAEIPSNDEYKGDQLLWYNNESEEYDAWRLVHSASGTNYWKKAMVSNPDANVISRGEALILVRAVSNQVIYVVGQVGTNSTVITTISPGAADDPVYTLIAPPSASGAATDANALKFTGTIDDKDRIMLDTKIGAFQSVFIREEVAGVKQWVNVYPSAGTKIPAGRGFYYERHGIGELSVTWSAPAVN